LNRTDEIIKAFISAQDVRESSKGTYQRTLKQYFAWIRRKGYDLSQVARPHIIEFKSELLILGLSALTAGSYISSVRRFYEWCESEKIYPNVAKGVKSPKRQNKFKRQGLTPEQSHMFLSYFKERSTRDYAIISLLLRTGIRTIELCRADVADITFKSGQRVLKIKGKGHDDKDDFVCITDKTYQALNNYLQTRGRIKPGDPLFISDSNNSKGKRLTTKTISSTAKYGLRHIGLDGHEFTAHSLRHTCAETILRAGGTIQDAQGVLRHASSVTTQIYIQSLSEEKRLLNPAENLIETMF
jgi:integrase/recombinase XerC/integrase/recombinase XerD